MTAAGLLSITQRLEDKENKAGVIKIESRNTSEHGD